MLLQRFKQFGRAVDQMHRYRVIVGVFLKYGYKDLARRLPLPKTSRLPFRATRKKQEAIDSLTQAERLRLAFEELGPTFVKFGQLLSSRAHLLPPLFVAELSKLHDQVPPIPFPLVKAVLEDELKRPLAECFAAIEEAPLGSASIAQVHRATLLDGGSCVVKVQRPGIEKIVRVDLEIMAQLASLLENNVDGWKVNRPSDIVAEFAKRLERELDFNAEAAHMERFAHQFAGDSTLHVPRVYRQTCTERVLTMEYIDGIKASQVAAIEAAGLDRREIATRIAELLMKQVFVNGLFHADPHPGNIRVLPGNVICFLDFGMMGFLDLGTRESFVDLIQAISEHDECHAARALLKMSNAELDPPRLGLEADVAEFMDRHFYRPVGDLVFAKLVNHLFHLTGQHMLTMPPDVFTMLKAMGLMEAIVSKLDPGHDILAQAHPFLRKVQANRLRPRRLLRQWRDFGAESAIFVREFPLEIRRLFAQMKRGEARVTFHHEGLEPLDNTLERVSNRHSFALVLAALIISSSLIIHARLPPMWHGVPVIGVVGYVFAGFMGFWLLVSILRHGKM